MPDEQNVETEVVTESNESQETTEPTSDQPSLFEDMDFDSDRSDPYFDEATLDAEDTPGEEPQAEEASTSTAEQTEGEGSKGLPPPKSVKVNYKGEEVEYAPGEMVVPTVVDGEEQSPTLQDLRTNYAGKVNWGKKFEELANDRKGLEANQQKLAQEQAAFEQNQKSVNSRYESWAKTLQSGDVKGFVEEVVKTAGVEPDVFWQSVRAEVVPEEYTEEQKALLDLRRENASLKNDLQQEREGREGLKNTVETDAQINRIAIDRGITPTELQTAWKEIVEAGQQGLLSKEDVKLLQDDNPVKRAEYTANRVVAKRKVDKVVGLMNEIDPKIGENEEALKHLFAVEATGASNDTLRKVAAMYATNNGQGKDGKESVGNGSKGSTEEQPQVPDERAVYKRPGEDYSSALFDDL